MFCSETTNAEKEKKKKEISFWVVFIKVSFSRVSSLTCHSCVAVQKFVGTGTGSEWLREAGMSSCSDITTACQVKVHETMAYVFGAQNLKKKVKKF